MRSFKLTNGNGVVFDLMRTDAFFATPSGLGHAYDTEYLRAGNAFMQTNRYLQQKSISGEMVFSGYITREEFKAFIAITPLTLGYQNITEWRYIDVELVSFELGEIAGGALRCPVSFACLSTWYTETTYAPSESLGGKIYPYQYSYTYKDNATGAVSINNPSKLEASVRLHIFGPCTNPAWSITRNGIVEATGAITAVIAAGNKLVVDSNPNEMEITEYTTANVPVRDLYQYSDFSTTRFVMLQQGENIVSVSHAGSEKLSFTLEVRAAHE